MISYLWIFVVGWACICDGGTIGLIGSETKNYKYSTSLCDAIFSARETLSSSLSTAFGVGDVTCAAQNECRRLKCFSSNEMVEVEGRSNLNFIIDLNLCQDVQFRAESLSGKEWSLIIPLLPESYKVGRYKIDEESPQKHLFVKISAVQSADKEMMPLPTFMLQSCNTEESESSCLNFPLFSLPYLHINLCDHVKTKYLPRNRSSRSVVVDPHDLHIRRSDNSHTSTSQIDRPCQLSNIHSCGKNAACVNSGGNGICECLEGFVPYVNGTCIRSVDPPAHHRSSSYSPVLGTILAILLLVGMAAAAFYGAKYQVLQRIRNQLPVSLRCRPFPVIRRTRAADDNVSLVYPIDDDGDDEPLLL